ncbi:MAG: flap endonuclease-1 [Candidatus Parvarchaeota archaeon]|nr:flap endonuclease-1 [Candidatus Rehaiarchaeum fermentans]
MGVNLRSLVKGNSIELKQLSGKRIAIDAYNWIYQFVLTIRLDNGMPLMNSSSKLTSHLNGLFYRTINLLENNIIPIFVFDGKYPEIKRKEIERRKKIKEEMKILATTSEENSKYLLQSYTIDNYTIDSSKKLLKLMGIPIVQAPEEGEAEAAYLTISNKADYVASQDYDAFLFGARRIVRNLNIAGKRKVPNKAVFKSIKPEEIILDKLLNDLGIDREKLILIAMFLGTDYNEGVKGIGPKKAISIVKKESKEYILSNYDFGCEDPKFVFNYFLNPPVEDVENQTLVKLDRDNLIKFLVEENDFSMERVTEALDRIKRRDAFLA